MQLQASLLAAALVFAGGAEALPQFVNGLALPGDLLDLSGGQTANDGRVGYFSDLYYDVHRNEWWALSDRGPGGGTLSYDTRLQRFTLDVDPVSGAISNFQIVQTVRFTSGGVAFNGLAPNPGNVLGFAFDPEGLVVHPVSGNLLVSDEYGPSVYEFSRSGEFLRAFTIPDNLIPRNVANVPNFASDTGNVAGKRTNRGFEGLAVSPDGQYVYAMLQSAMLDEGGGNGTVSRIVKFDHATGTAVAQYAYQLDTANQGRGISALLALNDTDFLVLERNNRGIGVGATLASPDKRVYQISLTGATDVSSLNLSSGQGYTPVSKSGTVFIDLDTNTLPELGNKSPEKWEGLAIGPRLNDGSYLILAGTDNDYSVTQNGSNQQFDVYFRMTDADPYATSIQCPLGQTVNCQFNNNGNPAGLTADYRLLPGVLHAYKASASDLAGYVAPVPLPPALALFAPVLGALAPFCRRRRH